MALVGSISGSSGITALTGSLIPGAVSNELGSSTSKWLTVYANNITGSIQKTGGGNDFIKAGPNITANYNSLGQWEITGAAGGGGGGETIFTAANASAAYTTSSIAIGQAAAASTIGSNLFFYVSGSKTSGGRPASGVASFGGDLVVTGTLYLGDGSVSGIYNRDGSALLYSTSPTSVVLGQDVILNTNVIKANDGNTAITLSSTNVTVAGNITGSNALVNGALTTTGDATIGGNIVADAEEAKSIFVNVGANNVTIGGASSNVVIGNDLQVNGNDIKASDGNTNITLTSNSLTTFAGDIKVGGNDIQASDGNINITMTSNTLTEVKGDLQVTGNDIKMNGGTTAVTFSGAGDVALAGDLKVGGNDIQASDGNINITMTSNTLTEVKGDLQVTGNDIKNSAGITSITMTAGGTVVIPGDLEVQGTTMTVSASNLVVEDPLVGFGFLTGSTPGTSTGDRGFVGGYVGTGNNNVAFGYSLSNSAFVATRTTSDATSTTFTVSDLQPLRASKFQVSGSTAELKGDGSTLQLSGTQLDVFAASKGVILYREGTLYGDLTGQPAAYNGSNGLRLQAGGNGYATAISGSTVWLNADQGNVYVGRSNAGTPNSGLLVSVNPGGAGGAGGFVQLTAKQNDSASSAPLPMTLTGSNLTLSVANALLGVSIQDTGTEFATISKSGTASIVKSTNDLILSGTTATVQSQTGNVTLRNALTTQSVNFNVGASTHALIQSASYVGGGVDAISLGNTTKFQATNDLVIAASATAGSIVLSGSSAAYINMGQNLTLQQAGTTFLQFISSSYALQNVGTSQVVRLEGRNTNGILLQPAAGQKVFLSGSVELGGGADNSVNFRGQVGTNILPAADSTYTLGSPSLRWQHIYTGDLHLRNERGDYTLIEENDFLSIRFNKNGKRYKFLLERVPELDEPR